MPVDVVEFSTTDPDVGHAALNQVYGAAQPIAFSGPDQAFACDLRFATAGGLGADRVRFTMVAHAEMAPVDFFLAVSPVGGAQRVAAGRDEVHLRPGGVARYPNDSVLVARGIFDVTTLRLPLAVIERVAAERLGADPADLRFDGMRPVSEPMRRQWLGLMRFVHQQLAAPASGVTHLLVEAQLVELVAATALVVFPNTTMRSDHLRSPGAVAPAVVRRAVAFIDGHASLPITVTDVARAAGVGPRALQLAFAHHLGCSPMTHVRRVRLEGAHRELQAADPTAGDTVAAIAARWGFARPDRFAAAYRAAYGAPPSHTLRT
jgi:AraC-like DNA-binding protein